MSVKTSVAQELIDDLMGDLREEVIARMETLAGDIYYNIDKIKQCLDKELDNVLDSISDKPFVCNFGTVEKPSKEVVHKSFLKIVKILSSAKRKEKNIMLVGGAGGGKTHLVKQVADAMKLNFYPFSVGLQTTKSDLLGFISANGTYITSPIRQAFENGGVLLLDEFDAAHPGVVTILNSLLANEFASFPDGIVKKSDKFVCICACNTYGRGANVEYVGRNRLDAATLDRFIVVDVPYDDNLEKILTKNDAWYAIVAKIRENVMKQGIKVVVSPRACMDGADLLDSGIRLEDVLEMVIFKGVDNDIKNKMLEGVNTKGSKKVA